MRKLVVIILLLLASVCAYIGYSQKEENNNMNKIKVAEVTHSLFYLPWYIAIENKYFEDEGIDVELVLTPGADKVTSAILSGDVQIGLCGAEASMYVFNNKEKDYLINFAALTKRDGQFLVGKCDKNFKLKNLENSSILGGRIGGMPLMNFKYAMHKNNIDLEKININTSVEFAGLAGAFIGKEANYVNLFEPVATSIVNEGYGCVLESVGKLAGVVPYTTFNARKSYIEKNNKILKKFNNAIDKGLKFVRENDNKTLANKIYKQFHNNSLNEIESIIKRYKENDSWFENTTLTKESYKNLVDIMKYNKAIESAPSFNKIFKTNFNG